MKLIVFIAAIFAPIGHCPSPNMTTNWRLIDKNHAIQICSDNRTIVSCSVRGEKDFWFYMSCPKSHDIPIS